MNVIPEVERWIARSLTLTLLYGLQSLITAEALGDQPGSVLNDPNAVAVTRILQRPPDVSKISNVATLVRMLGDTNFSVRTQAARQLSAIGAPAKEALIAALKSPDQEIRRQARKLLPAVLADDDSQRLEAFVAGAPETNTNRLPGWNKYRKLIGDDGAARALFAAMAESEPILLEAIDQGPQQAAQAVDALCREVTSTDLPRSSSGAVLSNCKQTGFNAANGVALIDAEASRRVLGIVAAMLLASSDPAVRIDDASHETLKDLIGCCSNHDALLAGTPLRRLVSQWMNNYRTAEQAGNCLTMALSLELPEGAQVAKRVIAEAYCPGWLRRQAIMTIARFGTQRDIAALLPLLNDETPCEDEPGDCPQQARDVALAAILHLAGQEPACYGMAAARPNSETVYDLESLRFFNDQQRQTAFKRWQFWLVALRLEPNTKWVLPLKPPTSDSANFFWASMTPSVSIVALPSMREWSTRNPPQ